MAGNGARKLIYIGLDGLMPEMTTKFKEEGLLPNIGRLMDEGTFSYVYSDPPVDTPTNWSCLATGAHVGTHGMRGFSTHLPGHPIDQMTRISHSLGPSPASIFQNTPNEVAINWLCQAEYLWEAATKAGRKCIVIDWPGGYPARMEGIRVVNGCGPYCSVEACFLPPGRFSTTDTDDLKETTRIHFEPAIDWLGLPESGPVPLACEVLVSGQYPRKAGAKEPEPNEELPDTSLREIPIAFDITDDLGGAAEEIAGDTSDLSQVKYQLLLLGSDGKGYDRLLICRGRDTRQKLAELRVGQWTPWLKQMMRVRLAYRKLNAYDLSVDHADVDIELMFKFKLLRLSPDGQDVVLHRTALFNPNHWTNPEELGESLIDELFVESQRRCLEGMLGDDVLSEQHPGVLGAFWHARVPDVCDSTVLTTRMLVEKEEWDALFVQIHAPDGINHRKLTYLDPKHPDYDLKTSEEVWDEFRAEYQALDGAVGGILEACATEDAVVAVVSDHAAFPVRRQVWLVPALAKAGLVGFAEDRARGTLRMVPGMSRIYPSAGGLVVHDKGRFESGIVERRDVEDVVDQAIAALYSIRDPLNGKCPIAAALRLEDATVLGQWGDRCPDMLVFLVPGYGQYGARGAFSKKALDGPVFRCLPKDSGLRGQHGANLPQSVMKEEGFSARAVFVFAGPGVRKGYVRPRASWTVDAVPTLAHLVGLPKPAQCEGRILDDALVD